MNNEGIKTWLPCQAVCFLSLTDIQNSVLNERGLESFRNSCFVNDTNLITAFSCFVECPDTNRPQSKILEQIIMLILNRWSERQSFNRHAFHSLSAFLNLEWFQGIFLYMCIGGGVSKYVYIYMYLVHFRLNENQTLVSMCQFLSFMYRYVYIYMHWTSNT